MKTIATIFAATAMMTGVSIAGDVNDYEAEYGHPNPNGARFVNVWLNDNVEDPIIENVERMNNDHLKDAAYYEALID